MRNNRGITLISVAIVIVLLLIIAGISVTGGIDSYKASKVLKFETNMIALQKKVDLIVEEKIDYETLGESLSSNQKNQLSQIINEDANVLTDNVDEESLRYFSEKNIEKQLELSDVGDEIIVNFSNREIISLNGMENNDKMHYVLKGLR